MKWESWINRGRWERRMDAELRFHLNNVVRHYIDQGFSREEAIVQARRDFGTVELAKDECRDQRPLESLDQIWRDVRYAVRSLRKSPALATAVIVTLALAIGANAAIFSVLEGAILEALPYREPDHLVAMALFNRNMGHTTYASYADFVDWQRNSLSFEQIAAIQAAKGMDLSGPGLPERVEGAEISSNFFATLGTKLQLGREMSADEDKPGGPPAVVINDRLWRERFSASPAVLGKTITLEGVDYSIVGVLSAEFRFDKQLADVFTSIGRDTDFSRTTDRTWHDTLCIARLRPRLAMAQALAEMNTVQEHIDELHPDTERGEDVWIVPLRQYLVGDVAGTVLLLLGAVGLLLLVACANVANLLLARSVSRTREFAIRLTLGAARRQIVRQLIVESVLLSLAGGVLGLAIAKPGLALVLAMVPGAISRADDVGVNGTVLLFTFTLSVLVGIVFGLTPALRSSKADIQTRLKQGGRNSNRRLDATQPILVVAQVAMTLVLLVGGSLLFRTILNLSTINPGFDAHDVLTFQVGLSSSIATAPALRNAYAQLVERIHAIPGVESVDISGNVPFRQLANEGPFWLGAHPPVSMAEIPRAIYSPIGPDYFTTMKIPLIRGRSFAPTDTVDSPLVVVVDDLMARTYFHDIDPVGQSLTIPHWGEARDVAARIVGVVDHVEQYSLDGTLGRKPQIYYSFYQLPDDGVAGFSRVLRLVVRTHVDITTLMPVIRNAVYASGADQPVFNVETMQEFVTGSMARQRFSMFVLATFASLALMLAVIGTYGVVSYSTAQRAHEIGIRLALGAGKNDVLRLVVGQGIRLAFGGVLVGTSAAVILARILPSFSHLLFGIQATDPVTIGATSVVLLTSAVAACYIPARRASRMDGIAALRQE